MPAPVYVVNTGTISAIGADTAASLDALVAGRSGIGTAQLLHSTWTAEIPVGEVPQSNAALAQEHHAPEDWPRTALLSLYAASEAWRPFAAKELPYPIGFFNATTVGGMDRTEDFYPEYLQDKTSGRSADFIHHDCGAVTRLWRVGWASVALLQQFPQPAPLLPIVLPSLPR